MIKRPSFCRWNHLPKGHYYQVDYISNDLKMTTVVSFKEPLQKPWLMSETEELICKAVAHQTFGLMAHEVVITAVKHKVSI